ncbi:hypothetical protein BTVI_40987 [Pitangus sulphuratus]|nr:hypothetical protein BTVI_40987 [Pitangus sulphuratus]
MTSDLKLRMTERGYNWLQYCQVQVKRKEACFPGTQKRVFISGIQQRTTEMIFRLTVKGRQEAEVPGIMDPATPEMLSGGKARLMPNSCNLTLLNNFSSQSPTVGTVTLGVVQDNFIGDEITNEASE